MHHLSSRVLIYNYWNPRLKDVDSNLTPRALNVGSDYIVIYSKVKI